MKPLGVLLMCAMLACGDDAEQLPPAPIHQIKESLVEANKVLVRNEAEDIAAYMVRHQWSLNETGSGLRYHIYEHGNGLKAEAGKVARLQYTLSLLNGKICYRSKERGLMEFRIGRGGVESGLEEAILLMREGDRGRFILPSHLAHGLLGDDDCIPAKASVVYDIKLLTLHNRTN